MADYGTILLVEDDISLASWMSDYLQQKGYQVVHHSRGDTVMAAMPELKVDLILLDLMLPGINGLELCRLLRQQYPLPILMLTAQGEEMDEVLGLQLGASDYLIKPVRPRVLLARIEAALRNRTKAAQVELQLTKLDFGQLEICAQSQRVRLFGNEIVLTSTEFSLLWFLASRAGQICSRDQVFMALKGREHDGLDRRFDVMVSVLRKKLSDDATNPKGIKTVWGKGYLFVADGWL
ncbi:MAG: response regulator [Gammaproteobacteria bacterium]|jgi:two-component system, OmpR family, response regulator|nr:response regulator [Gammaproteobacteria bacterium]MBU2180731.1 response regulator [Gammaproteobacteria bacterium]MBU2223625.1 response regulator [Gammaproteobacteria bacterium]MBU2279919.1 response regulator [Gammaproteobacteria bacterium]MBU2426249.1 response regulator [Gammaproteobacteria bacterium]